MNLTLEVSVEDILKGLSDFSNNTTFITSLAWAKELQKQNNDDYITLFGKAFHEIDSNQRLSAIFIIAPEMKAHRINYNSTNEDVIAVLRDEVPKTINLAVAILKTRIQNYGLSKNIEKFEIKNNRMHLEIYGIDNPERFKKLLTAVNKLEFWETYENEELIESLTNTNRMLREMQIDIGIEKVKTTKKVTPSDTIKNEEQSLLDLINKDSTNITEANAQEEFTDQNPLFAILRPRLDDQGQPLPSCMIGLTLGKDTAKVISYLKMDPIRALFPRNIKFYWSKNPHEYDTSKSLYELHAIKINSRDGTPAMSNFVSSAKASLNKRNSTAKIDVTMFSEEAKRWAMLTRNNIGSCIAIVVDDYVRAYPRVMNQITGGKIQITGDFTIEEANDLANTLKSGQLPAEIKIVEEQITIGK